MCKAIVDFIKGLFPTNTTTIIVPVERTLPDKIEPNPWQVLSFIAPEDKDSILRATYCDEFGTPKTFFCNIVWSNDQTHQYKLTAPELGPGIIIEKGNVTDFSAIKIPVVDKNNYKN